MSNQIRYSDTYCDDTYEYRHVLLPMELAVLVPKNHLMTETEWRNLGIQQSPDWEHYAVRLSELHVVPFRRRLDDPRLSVVSKEELLGQVEAKKNESNFEH